MPDNYPSNILTALGGVMPASPPAAPTASSFSPFPPDITGGNLLAIPAPASGYGPGWTAPSLNPWQAISGSPPPPSAWSPDGGQTVYIVRPDGTLETRTGGSVAWRNNNPGNIAESQRAEIGHTGSGNARHAIYDSPEAGNASLGRLLFDPNAGSDFPGKSIAGAITEYAPRKTNNTDAYIADIVRRTGLDSATILNTMTDQQRAAFMNAIRAHEKTTPGNSTVSIYNPF